MMKLSGSDIVLKALGILLLAAAVMKAHELLTTPMANADIWTNHNFMIFQVEFELALGIWLISGLFKRVAWLAALGCFVLFCGVTLYKGLAGYASCGCFGNVHVNPWITFFAVDLPAVVFLILFRPKLEKQRLLQLPHWLEPMPKFAKFSVIFLIGLSAIAISSPVLILNEPAVITSSYEVLEPETWIGKELPILDHIDIGEQFKTGNWLIVLYHHDCPSCTEALPKIEKMARVLENRRLALVEIPPYALNLNVENLPYTRGRLSNTKKWFVTTPVVLLTDQSSVQSAWEGKVPDKDNLI